MDKPYKHNFPREYRGSRGFVSIGGMFVAMGSGVRRISRGAEGKHGHEASDGTREERRVLRLRIREFDLGGHSQ